MDWLPELLCCDGDWATVVEKIYARFKEDFVDRPATFKGSNVKLRYVPREQNKESTFWHLISEGEREDERTPDFRRCERIGWVRAILDHADDPELKVWEQSREGKTNIAIALPDFSYVVFLGKRSPENGDSYVLLLTAYCVEKEKKRAKYRREYEIYSQK